MKSLAEQLKAELQEIRQLRQVRLEKRMFRQLTEAYAASADLFSAADPIGDFDSLTYAGYQLDLLTGKYFKKEGL